MFAEKFNRISGRVGKQKSHWFVQWLYISCRGRTRTYTGQLAKVQRLVVNPGRPYHWSVGSTLRLSCYPHPRDERACLPKSFITPQFTLPLQRLEVQY